MSLYTDDHPETTIKGTGFKDMKTAKNTLKLIEKRSKIYQWTLINTLYHRAKNHPHKSDDILKVIKFFEKWLKTNKNLKPKYSYLPLDLINKYEKLAEKYDISHVARGLKKPIKSDEGFLVIYRKVKGNPYKLSFIPIHKKYPEKGDYDILREKFINARLGQIKKSKIPLFGKDGLPTIQHTVMIMNGYSPEKDKLIKALKFL